MSLLTKLAKRRVTSLVGAMQDFLGKEMREVHLGVQSKHAPALAECDFVLEYYAQRKKQHATQGARDRSRGYFHASQISGCLRAVFFNVMDAPEDAPSFDPEDVARSEMIFSNGDFMHVRLMALLRRMGVLQAYEVPFSNPARRTEGHADAVVLLNGERYVVDFKSINSRGFNELQRTGAPKDAHVDQVSIYARELGVTRWILLYEDKDRQVWLEFTGAVDPARMQRLDKRMDTVNAARKRFVPPPREGDTPNADICRWCSFKSVCFHHGRLEKWLSARKAIAAPSAAPVHKQGKLRIKIGGVVR